MRALLVSEAFKRNTNPLDAMNIGKHPKITVTLPTYDIEIKKNKLNIKDENTKYFNDVIVKNHIEYNVLGFDGTYWDIEFTGTKDQLIPLFVLFDANGRNEDELKNDLQVWTGDNNEIIDELY
jgi:hypothetical protein